MQQWMQAVRTSTGSLAESTLDAQRRRDGASEARRESELRSTLTSLDIVSTEQRRRAVGMMQCTLTMIDVHRTEQKRRAAGMMCCTLTTLDVDWTEQRRCMCKTMEIRGTLQGRVVHDSGVRGGDSEVRGRGLHNREVAGSR